MSSQLTPQNPHYRPQMTRAGRPATHEVTAVNEHGDAYQLYIPGEEPLTVHLEDREIVTLMTIGSEPETLALGYLFNQRLIDDIESIKSIHVDWEKSVVQVETFENKVVKDWRERMFKRIVTSGCGQGTIFASTLEELDGLEVQPQRLKQSALYGMIREVAKRNEIYRRAGAVHSCALCQDDRVLYHVEDVGRHNATDAIAGYMWLERLRGHDKIFYSTGRLTSEMVMKAAFMGIPCVVSRSGATQMGVELAKKIGMIIITRAKGSHFLIYSGAEYIDFDAPPKERRPPPRSKGMRDL